MAIFVGCDLRFDCAKLSQLQIEFPAFGIGEAMPHIYDILSGCLIHKWCQSDAFIDLAFHAHSRYLDKSDVFLF